MNRVIWTGAIILVAALQACTTAASPRPSNQTPTASRPPSTKTSTALPPTGTATATRQPTATVVPTSTMTRTAAPEPWRGALEQALRAYSTNWLGEGSRSGTGYLLLRDNVDFGFIFASGGGVLEDYPLPGHADTVIRTGTPAYYLYQEDLAYTVVVTSVAFRDRPARCAISSLWISRQRIASPPRTPKCLAFIKRCHCPHT